MARNVTTEWHDIQVELGNFVPIELPPTGEEINEENMEIMEGYDQKKAHSDEDSDPDFREDEEEKEIIKGFREKRLQEMKEEANKKTFGYVKHITKQDWVLEINEAPKGVHVVLLLYQDYIELSVKLVEIFEILAKHYPHVKF
eukprot:CAMPEP_0197003300 /NCGR_PEP_ID=MMETSP1380-20130617/7605_1 /TAXON_ID=5936 /ORGANISM="Euplotes crassus, Strain CT5" /LENGTH=142 /DNA_ID=CAMNT_0042421763 /DNA_START=25 /DNA_END=453 /DNA_ORIENTATION=-